MHLDAPETWAYGFQDGATVTFEGITELYNSVMFFIVAIIVGVFYALIQAIVRFGSSRVSAKYLTHGTVLEFV